MLSEKISDVFYEKRIPEAIEAACNIFNNNCGRIMVYDSMLYEINGERTPKMDTDVFQEIVNEAPGTVLNAIQDDEFNPTDEFWVLNYDEGVLISTDDIISLLYEQIEYAEEGGYLTEDDVKEELGID